MPIDPTKHADWEVAEAAEKNMKTVYELSEQLGLEKEELLPQMKKNTSPEIDVKDGIYPTCYIHILEDEIPVLNDKLPGKALIEALRNRKPE